MKKSNVRFFRGEPPFSGEQPLLFQEHVKMHKCAFRVIQLLIPNRVATTLNS
jgi:hypothetical protein